MFLYVALPLGAATSGLTALGFSVGAFWSTRLERNRNLAQAWPKLKVWLRALGLLPIAGFGVFAIARGLVAGEVWIPRRYSPLSTVSLLQEPLGYSISMAVWCAITVGLVYWQFKELRRAHAI
jgi:hypothetical protein